MGSQQEEESEVNVRSGRWPQPYGLREPILNSSVDISIAGCSRDIFI